MAGASMVGICTAAIYQGADIYKRVADEAAAWLDAHGYASISDVQGLFLEQYRDGQRVVVEKEEAPYLVEDRCIGCARCDQVCFYDAIAAPPWKTPTITEASCFQCGLCVSACPTDALRFRPRADVTAEVP
jgi:Na+-translocating ferredoxin:NAD+ oxidoreductase RNF subunit RnfB